MESTLDCERRRKQATALCTFINGLSFKFIFSFLEIPYRTDSSTNWTIFVGLFLCILYIYLLTKWNEKWIDFLFLAGLNSVVFLWIQDQAQLRNISLLIALNEAPTRIFIPVVTLLIGGNRMGSFFCSIHFLLYIRAGRMPLDAIPAFYCATDLATVLALIIFHNQYKERIDHLLQQKCISEENANRAKTIFIAKMSHDLRTPLNGLVGFLNELLNIGTHLPEEAKAHLKVIYLCATSLERLIQDLLDVSLMELGRIHLAKNVFNIYESFDSLTALFKRIAAEKKLFFSFSLDPNFPKFLKGDWARIQQIITNLVNNAIKFTKEGGSIQVLIRHKECQGEKVGVEFMIKDTGIGIPEFDVNNVFKSFFQCRKDDAEKGSGLGLFICQQLVTCMGGDIHVESKEEEGTTFFGHFLLEKAEFSSQEEVPKIDLTGLRVLVAEDNSINMKLITRILQSYGVSCRTAWNGIEAVEEYEKHSEEIDVILMDVQMPKMGGVDATLNIRSLQKKHLPIIAVTAGVTESEIAILLQAGFDSYISKPVHREKLKKELEKWKP